MYEITEEGHLELAIQRGAALDVVFSSADPVSVVLLFAAGEKPRCAGTRSSTPSSVTGALAIIGAGFNGASFVNYGHAFSSMIMAGLWALALACYLAGAILALWRA